MICDREGIFRGDIIGMALKAVPGSETKFLDLKCKVHDHWTGSGWEDWREYDMVAYGSLCIVKRDGSINTVQAEPLMQFSGWDGDFTSLENCQTNPVRFTTKSREYQKDGQTVTVFEVEWIDDYDKAPGGGLKSNVDASDLKGLNARFGAQLRALKGNGKRNAAKPAGKPSAPPAAASSDIPF